MGIGVPAFLEKPAGSPEGTGKSAQLESLRKNSCLNESLSKALMYCYTSCTPSVLLDFAYLQQLNVIVLLGTIWKEFG